MIHFACARDSLEDRQTIAYLAETAEQAGKDVELMDMIGDECRELSTRRDTSPVTGRLSCFMLYRIEGQI